MKERLFRFKHFSVKHSLSSMKVGVDGVLIGAWGSVDGSRCLDVGTGCGLIALMAAQRNEKAEVTGIDIDALSVEEARDNAMASPWRERVEIRHMAFEELLYEIETGKAKKYDALVSNPPYFDAGVTPDSRREKARHDGALSPSVIIKASSRIVSPGGNVSIIAPVDRYDELSKTGERAGLWLTKVCYVRNHARAADKRVMLEFKVPHENIDKPSAPEIKWLTMFEEGAEPTEEYRKLCEEFYLKF